MATDTATIDGGAPLPLTEVELAAPGVEGARAVSPRVALFLQWVRWTDMLVALGALLGAFLLTNVGRMPGGLGDFLALRLTVKNLLLLLGFAVAWRAVCALAGLYRWEVVRDRRRELLRVLAAASVGSAAALVFPAISVTGAFRHTTVVVALLVAATAMVLARAILRSVIDLDAEERYALLVVGTGPRGLTLGRRLAAASSARLLGYVDAAGPATPRPPSATSATSTAWSTSCWRTRWTRSTWRSRCGATTPRSRARSRSASAPACRPSGSPTSSTRPAAGGGSRSPGTAT